MNCIDLRPWADVHRYRWRYEESCKAERDTETRGDGSWYVEVICWKGLLYSWGDDELTAYTASPRVWRSLLALDPSLRRGQTGDRERTVRFPSRLLDQVAEILRPKRLQGRAATPEDRARLALHAFQTADNHRNLAQDRRKDGETTPDPSGSPSGLLHDSA